MNVMKAALALIITSTVVTSAKAISVDWSGVYRFEVNEIDKVELKDGSRKSYALNYLGLSPKIIAADGFNIVAKFDILQNASSEYHDSQLGQVWGSGPCSTCPGTTTNIDNSSSLAQHQAASSLKVSQLYLNINQEFGSIVVGRAPMHFGLGITHNAGNGSFDHWYDTRDMVGYKFWIGNLFMMPSISKVKDASPSSGGETSDQTFHLEYDNKETGNTLGIFYETRKGSISSNDTPLAAIGGASRSSGFSSTAYNVLFGKQFDTTNFKIEAAFMSGTTGVDHSTGGGIDINAFAVATELNYVPTNAKGSWHLKFGTVSGDDPQTANFEGYLLDRNYDVAFLLFNHRLGQVDPFNSALARSSLSSTESLDEQVISNVMYIAPKYTFKSSDKLFIDYTFVMAQLNNATIKVGSGFESIGADVGYEFDIALRYKPYERVEWINEFGFFSPGSAFKGGSANHETASVIGFASRAAISF